MNTDPSAVASPRQTIPSGELEYSSDTHPKSARGRSRRQSRKHHQARQAYTPRGRTRVPDISMEDDATGNSRPMNGTQAMIQSPRLGRSASPRPPNDILEGGGAHAGTTGPAPFSPAAIAAKRAAQASKKELSLDMDAINLSNPMNGVQIVRSPTADVPENNQIAGMTPQILDAVVKIYASHCGPNYSLPWQMKCQTQSTSTGFVVEGRRLLTNAHCVYRHTIVKVEKRGNDHKYTARVLAIGNECDLALMTVDDPSFWEGIQPLKFGPLPQLQDSVCVIGYAIGGENIAITAGVVSRIEIQEYTHVTTDLLGIQIDAAINFGSSGAPALNNKQQVVGIAFQVHYSCDTENVGYLIPESVVRHFLHDFDRNGRYTGFCYCGFEWSRMDNPDLRMSMGMGPKESGIMVKLVDIATDAAKVLRKGDIITHMDGAAISNAGTTAYRNGERISYIYLITQKFVGDPIDMRILRDKKPLNITYTLSDGTSPLLIPSIEPKKQPDYLVIGGLLFVVATEPYLMSEYGIDYAVNAPVQIVEKLLHCYKESEDHETVVLSKVMHAEVNTGYEYHGNLVLREFNGQKIKNLKHLAKLISGSTDEYFRFDLALNEVVVLSRKKAVEAEEDILSTHSIPKAAQIDGKEFQLTRDGAGNAEGKQTGRSSSRKQKNGKRWRRKKGKRPDSAANPRSSGTEKSKEQRRDGDGDMELKDGSENDISRRSSVISSISGSGSDVGTGSHKEREEDEGKVEGGRDLAETSRANIGIAVKN